MRLHLLNIYRKLSFKNDQLIRPFLLFIFTLTILCSFSSCSYLFYHPNQIVYTTPEKFELNYEEKFVDSTDQVKLHAWHIKTKVKKPLGTIVFFHGNAQNISAHFLQAAWFTLFGYNVFIGDYRGYGKSLGTPNQKALVDDAKAMIKTAYEIHLQSKTKHFILYGQSLGGAVVVPALAKSEHLNSVDLLILDSTFQTYKKTAFKVLSSNFITFLFSPLTYVLVSNEYAPYKFIKDISNIKALFIHSESDAVVKYELGREFYEDYQGQKDFWAYNGYPHITIFNHQKNRLRLINYLKTL